MRISYIIAILLIEQACGGFEHAHAAEGILIEKDAITPDDAIQEQIDRVVRTVKTAQRTGSQLEFFTELEALRKNASVPGSTSLAPLMEQLIYYARHARNTEEAMGLIPVYYHLGISKRDQIHAIAPYLRTSDVKLRQDLYSFLAHVDSVDGGGPGFRPYETVIRRWPESPPLGLIQYMYLKSPPKALLTLLDIYELNRDGRRAVLWAEHVVADAIWKKEHDLFDEEFHAATPAARADLEKLSSHNQWWVRLYAAEILNRHPEFRTPELTDRLKKDDHELVREAISRKNERRK